MLSRKKTPQKTEKDWFMFSSMLYIHLCSDYIALKLLYYLEPFTTFSPILVKAVEVAEKSLKFFLAVHNQSDTALSDAAQNYGHNLEKMRVESAKYNEVYNRDSIKNFTKEFNDKKGELYQYLRYGSQKTTEGMSAKLDQIMPIIDIIFFSSIMLLPENMRDVYNFTSLLKNLLTGSQFDQSQNPDILLSALKHKNNLYIDLYTKYCNDLDEKHKKQLEQVGVDKSE